MSDLFGPTEKVQILLQLRQHGTNPTDADPIYCSGVCLAKPSTSSLIADSFFRESRLSCDMD